MLECRSAQDHKKSFLHILFSIPALSNMPVVSYRRFGITNDDLNNIANAGYNCVRAPVGWGNFYFITNQHLQFRLACGCVHGP